MTINNPAEAGATGELLQADDNITRLPSVKYDVDQVEAFLSLVFHVELNATEEVLCWIANRHPGYPIDEDSLYRKLDRLTKPQAFYFATSTARRDPDGTVYNRKSLFERMHVLVLDDIGTKIPRDSIPDSLKPTYIVQSSAGNEQWGFVFEEPIDNLDDAQMLVSVCYSSGFTDTGGNTANKLVRLPCGFNMKEGKENDPVTLVHMDGPRWAPDDLLRELQTGITWEDITTKSEKLKQNRTLASGATAWCSQHIEQVGRNGIVDPVLEWLYAQDLVDQERNDWFDIKCPWHAEHTQGGNITAGYSPLGFGEGNYDRSRIFSCFHDSCNGRRGREFLEWVAQNGGPEVPTYDYVPGMTSTYVYDKANECAWDVKLDSLHQAPLSINSMRNVYARKIRVVGHKGDLKEVTPVQMWMVNPARVMVEGAEYNPQDRGRIFKDEQGNLKFNLFRAKDYAAYPVDTERVQVFYDYVEYLMPNEQEREYFLDWLACKVQNPSFRGPAMFMVAEKQGTGRNTLVDMISMMFGRHHTQHVSWANLTNSAYNSFQESLFTVIDETVSDGKTSRTMMDRLKELLDPRPRHAIVNPKYGKQRNVFSVTSYIFLSNHSDGLKLHAGDRRFYAIRNAQVPASPEYFTMVNKWMDTDGWQGHLWNDLMVRDVDLGQMVAPPEASEAMKEVIRAGITPLEVAVDTFIKVWPTHYVPVKLLKEALKDVSVDCDSWPDEWDLTARRMVNTLLYTPPKGYDKMKVHEGQFRLRTKPGKPKNTAWEDTRLAVKKYNRLEMVDLIKDAMADHGYDA